MKWCCAVSLVSEVCQHAGATLPETPSLQAGKQALFDIMACITYMSFASRISVMWRLKYHTLFVGLQGSEHEAATYLGDLQRTGRYQRDVWY
jgi:hypothetical protein